MGNCLKTQLKGSVQNDNLDFYGGIVYYHRIKSSEQGNIITTAFRRERLSTKLKVTILDANVTITGAVGSAAVIDTKHGYCTLYNDALIISGANADDYVKVLVESKYDVESVQVQRQGEAYAFNLSSLEYCTEMTGVFLGSSYLTGSIDVFATTPKLGNCSLNWAGGATGNIETALGNCLSLQSVALQSAQKVYDGSMDGLVRKQVTNGRSSGNILIDDIKYTYLPFGKFAKPNVTSSDTADANLTWKVEGGIIKMYLKSDLAGTNIYTIGYTQSEIDALKAGDWSGFEVYMADAD